MGVTGVGVCLASKFLDLDMDLVNGYFEMEEYGSSESIDTEFFLTFRGLSLII